MWLYLNIITEATCQGIITNHSTTQTSMMLHCQACSGPESKDCPTKPGIKIALCNLNMETTANLELKMYQLLQKQAIGCEILTVEKVNILSCTRIQLFLGSSRGVTIIDWWSQCCVCCCCQNVLGTRTRRSKTDGMICLQCHRPAGPYRVQGVRISHSSSHHRALPHCLIVPCHPQISLCAPWWWPV